MKKNPTVRTYIERHKVELYTVDERHKIKIRKRYINDKIKSKSVECKPDIIYDHKNHIRPLYISNMTKFNSDRKKNPFYDMKFDEYTLNDFPKKIDKKKILFVDFSNNMMFDYNGVPIPWLYTFGYIGTCLTNDILHIEKALKILKKHKDVKSAEIKNIPYYNQLESYTKYIQIKLLPSPDVYLKFFKIEQKEQNYTYRLKNMLCDGIVPDKKNNYLGLYPDAMKNPKANRGF